MKKIILPFGVRRLIPLKDGRTSPSSRKKKQEFVMRKIIFIFDLRRPISLKNDRIPLPFPKARVSWFSLKLRLFFTPIVFERSESEPSISKYRYAGALPEPKILFNFSPKNFLNPF